MSEEYLVIYEEEDDGSDNEDALVLDVKRLRRALRTHLDIETGVSLTVDNSSSRLGLAGLIVSIIGAVLAIAAVFLFATSYPAEFFKDGQIAEDTPKLVAGLAVFGMLFLIVGTALTAYGRRVTASGRLDNLQLVRKTPHAKTDLR